VNYRQTIFTLTTTAAIITNAAIAVFTMDVLHDYSTEFRFWFFIIFQWVVFSFQAVLMAAIPDEPHTIVIQRERREIILDKVIFKIPDADCAAVDYVKFDRETIQKLKIHEFMMAEAYAPPTSEDRSDQTATVGHDAMKKLVTRPALDRSGVSHSKRGEHQEAEEELSANLDALSAVELAPVAASSVAHSQRSLPRRTVTRQMPHRRHLTSSTNSETASTGGRHSSSRSIQTPLRSPFASPAREEEENAVTGWRKAFRI
jgi:hypothetical protein